MNIIYRGTTPTIRIRYKIIQVADIVKAALSLKQAGNEEISRDISTATKSEEYISWDLTQEETLSLISGASVSIQCDVVTADGKRGTSDPSSAMVRDSAKNEVL